MINPFRAGDVTLTSVSKRETQGALAGRPVLSPGAQLRGLEPHTKPTPTPGRSIPVVQTLWTTALTTACADHSDQHVGFLEHVVARISISHPRRGDLQIHLTSPSGTRSQLLAKR
jgi:hypothetical protein